MTPRRVLAIAAALLSATALVSCAGGIAGAPTSPPGDGTQLGVSTAYHATVLDDGSGPELCLGGVMESYPPQCGGPALTGWDWSDWEGHYEEASGVRWGTFWVAGYYNPWESTIAVEDAEPAEEHDWPDTSGVGEVDFTSPCPEPAGSWRVLDPALTTEETMYTAIAAAETLDGFAGSWIDQSPNPWNAKQPEPGDDEQMLEYEMSMNDPELLILNVRTTGDVAATESALREHWGGMLCVSAAERTQEELERIQGEIDPDSVGMLGSWSDTTTGSVHVEVVFDNGSIQAELDERYGEGLVRVSSALLAWP